MVKYLLGDITRQRRESKTVDKNITNYVLFFCYSSGLKNKRQNNI